MRAIAGGREVWLTEVNVLASYANDPRARNWNAFGSAWEASAFVRLGAEGANALFHYSFVHPGGNQFSVLDWTRGPSFGTPLLTYWTGFYLARFFPPAAGSCGRARASLASIRSRSGSRPVKCTCSS